MGQNKQSSDGKSNLTPSEFIVDTVKRNPVVVFQQDHLSPLRPGEVSVWPAESARYCYRTGQASRC
uniref:Transposase n=1 Tax=Macrostomum lignano TaxID=282301 RepID=A0A1I8JMM5_9PLAT